MGLTEIQCEMKLKFFSAGMLMYLEKMTPFQHRLGMQSQCILVIGPCILKLLPSLYSIIRYNITSTSHE